MVKSPATIRRQMRIAKLQKQRKLKRNLAKTAGKKKPVLPPSHSPVDLKPWSL